MQRWNHARLQITTDMARQQFRNGSLKKAVGTLQDALEADPEYLPANLLLGQIYLQQDSTLQARRCFEKCLKTNPDHPEANYYLGVIHEKINETDQALVLYRKALAGDPDHSSYLLAVAEILAAQNQQSEALALLQEHINQGQQDVSVYVAAGNILSSQKLTAPAIAMFGKARNLSPDNRDITASLAFALFDDGQIEAARDLFEQLQAHSDSGGSANAASSLSHSLTLGECYLRLGQFHNAQRCFERVSAEDSSNPAVWIKLSQAALGDNDFARAQTAAAKALALSPKEPDALLVSAYVSLKQQDYQQAEKTLEKILACDGNNGLAHCLLGQSYQAQGNYDKAGDCYTHALKIDPQDSLAKKLITEIGNTQIGTKPGTQSF